MAYEQSNQRAKKSARPQPPRENPEFHEVSIEKNPEVPGLVQKQVANHKKLGYVIDDKKGDEVNIVMVLPWAQHEKNRQLAERTGVERARRDSKVAAFRTPQGTDVVEDPDNAVSQALKPVGYGQLEQILGRDPQSTPS